MGGRGESLCEMPEQIEEKRREKGKNKRKELSILHYNCRGMANEERMQEFENALKDIKWDIIGLAEVRREGESLVKRKNDNYMYYYGETKGYRGVGFYIKGELEKDIIEIKSVSERVGVLKIRIEKNVVMTIIQVYAPTSEKSDEEIEGFYETVEKAIKENTEYYIIVMGDWNSKIGKGEKIQGILGPYGIGERNERGETLLDFAKGNNMKMAASFYKKREERKWTWESPDGKTKNEIDHALVNDMRIIKDVSTLEKFNFASDHRITRIKVQIPRRSRINNYKKSDRSQKVIPTSKTEEAIEYVRQKLEEEGAKENIGMQEYYNIIEEYLNRVVDKFGKIKDQITTDDKITKATKSLIVKREKLRRKKNKSGKDIVELGELRKVIKREIRKDIRTYEEELTCEIIEKSGSTKKLWKELSQGQRMMTNLRHQSGKLETDREKMIMVATEFYEKLYGRDKEKEEKVMEYRDERENNEEEEEEVPEILEWEVEEEIKRLKLGKAPGPDRIDNKIIKDFKKALIRPLTRIFNMILEKGEAPKQWELSEIMLIHKKGKRNEIENYRPISLTSNLCKLFMKILKNRVYKQLDLNQPEEQAGFRKKYSTIDHIHTLNQVIEKAREYRIELHMLFVDYRKAFDSIKHVKIWEGLKKQGIPMKIIRVLKNVYEKAKAYIKIDRKGPVFKVTNGIKQGDPMSSNIFNCVLEEIFRQMDWEKKGIEVGGCYLSNLRFADDIVLLNTNREELQEMARELEEVSKQGGLEMNIKKTQYMNNVEGNDHENRFTIESGKIEKVEEYVYLGQTISTKEGIEKELKARRSKAWGKFWSLQGVFKSRMTIKAKIKILESCVIPVLSYGAETWALTKAQTNSLQKTQRSMERIILGVRKMEKISNETIRERTKTTDIGYTIKKTKFKYAGHMIRGEKERWARKVTEWLPYGKKRRRGRPRTRWEDEIKNRVGTAWEREVGNRETWRKIGEAYARQWVAC